LILKWKKDKSATDEKDFKDAKLDPEGFDHVVFAIGRGPNDVCDIGKIGVAKNQEGFVKVDEYQNTNVKNVYLLVISQVYGN